MSAIEWTEKTWNPTVGCSIVSTECRECYAMKMAHRLAAMKQDKYKGLTEIVNGNVVWNGTVRLDESSLPLPLRTAKRTIWFVNSMSDLFHQLLPFGDVDKVFAVMQHSQARGHIFQVLTKRADLMALYFRRPNLYEMLMAEIDKVRHQWGGLEIHGFSDPARIPLPHVWLGTSVGYMPAKERIDHLRAVPAKVRFLSCEPLLSDLGTLNLEGIHWVIIGGESGPHARTMDIEWARNIVRQCKEQGVKVFVKQLGRNFSLYKHAKGGDMAEWPEDLRIREMPA